MTSLIVQDLPEFCSKQDLVEYFTSQLQQLNLENDTLSGSLKYVLYPIGSRKNKALLEFSSIEVATLLLSTSLEMYGSRLKISQAPRKTYTQIQAAVDPVIVASISDVAVCIQDLKEEFGVEVVTQDGGLTLVGSLLQIQCAQCYLDEEFQRQQRMQQQEFDTVGQDTPRIWERKNDPWSNMGRRKEFDEYSLRSLPAMHLGQKDRDNASARLINDLGPTTPPDTSVFTSRENRVEDMFSESLNQSQEIRRDGERTHSVGSEGLEERMTKDEHLSARVAQILQDLDLDEERRSRKKESSTVGGDHVSRFLQAEAGIYKQSLSRHSTGKMTDDTFFEDQGYAEYRSARDYTDHKQELEERLVQSARADLAADRALDNMADRTRTNNRCDQRGLNETFSPRGTGERGSVRDADLSQPIRELNTNELIGDTKYESQEAGRSRFDRFSQTLTPAKMAADMDAARTERLDKAATWAPRGLAVKDEYEKETIELDTLMLNYVRHIHSEQIDDMELKHGVMIDYQPSPDITTVVIYCLDDYDGVERKLKRVRDEFVAFYQKTYYEVVKEMVNYSPKEMDRRGREAAVDSLRHGFATSIYIEDNDEGQIAVIGPYDNVIVVVDWLKQKLGLKAYTGFNPMMSSTGSSYGTSSSKGLKGEYALDSSGKPRMVLKMEGSKSYPADDKMSSERKRASAERKSTERNTAGRKSPERKSPERKSPEKRISSRSSEKKLSRKSPERRKSSRSPEQSQRLVASSSRGRVSKTSKSLPDKGPMSPPTKLPSSKTRRSTADIISASSAKAARKTSPELRKTYPPVTGMQETSRTKPTGSLVPIYQQQAMNSCHSNSRHSNSRHSNSGQAEQSLEPSPAGELLTRLYGNSRLLRDRGDEEETPSSANLTYSFNTAEGIKVFVYQCDLTRLATDVIVNPANENLHHIGGVARAISDAAGPRLQMECTQYVTKNGPLKVSEVMCTPACGRLLCAYVVHTVGPVWALYTSPARCAAVLRQTVTNCLHYAANKLRAKSVAFPAISTGVYGVPLDVCARSMFEAIHAYSAATPRVTTVKHVHVVVNDAEGAGVMSAVFQQLRDAGYQECGYDSDVSSNADEIARSKSEKKTSKEKSSSKGSRKQKPKSATETNLNRVGDVGEFFEDNHRQAQGQDKVTNEQVEEALQKISLETMTSTQSTRSSVEGVKSPNERLPAQQDITSPRHDAVSPKHAMMSPREESKSFTERRSSSQDAISPRQQDMTSPREENKSSRSSSRRSSRQDPISQRDIAASPKEESVFLQEKAAQDITSPRQVKASPRQATTSVLDDVHSPQDSFHSPRQEVMSQREYFTSPRSSEANKDGVSSPKYPILSPREQIMSSQSPKQLASPKGEVNSPRDDFLSSQNMTSPKQNTISSNDEFKSPRSFRQSARSPTTQDITSPREEFKSPRTYTLSPRDDAAMTNQVTSPRGSITSPRQQITSPRYPIRSPKQPLTSPRGEQITSPREQQQVPSPQYPIMSPRQQITSPRERVASLTDDLKSPRQRLSSHESTTASTQPENGNMEAEVDRRIVLPGYQESPGAIVVSYTFPYGVQESHHPHPGEAYNGTTVVTFLPNTQDGRHALQLLQKAFNLGKLFTIDKWSQIVMSIHQKTKVEGGPERNGYPDPDYIQTLLEQLAALGIAADTQKQPSRTPSVDENKY